MKHRTIGSFGAFALVAALVALPSSLTAQECTATIEPAQVDAGEDATEITVSFSQQLGPVTSVEGASGSGITLAAPEDLPRIDLAAAEAPRPISMGEAPNTWSVWLNTADAQAGTHELTFRSSAGECTAQITIGS